MPTLRRRATRSGTPSTGTTSRPCGRPSPTWRSTVDNVLPGSTPSIFGAAWGTPQGTDLSMPSYMASGNQAVSEATLRRWTTTAGQLVDDPTYGRNVYDLINADLSVAELASEGQFFAAEAEKDERVLSCQVTLTLP